MKSIRIMALAILMVCSLTIPSFGQLGPILGIGKKKDPAPAATSKEDQNSEEFYLEMKEFAEGLYNKQVGTGNDRHDSDFKHRVDMAYEDKRRQDAARAFQVNMSAHSEVKHVIEDRFRVYTGLYDNLLVQDLLNRTGQSVIPATTGRLFTFKLKADPIPAAETLSTGTIYVTTGLVALLNTKAELAYVLAHEAAHVYHNHYRTEIMLDLAAEEYAKERGANQESVQKKLAIWMGIAGALTGGAISRSANGAAWGGVAGAATGVVVGNIVERQGTQFKDWNRIQEDEADRTAFEWLLNANLDVQEIPKVYAALKDAGDKDGRVTLGFLGRSNRVRERARKVDEMITLEKGKAEFSKRTWVGSDPDFDVLMAEVKRDNGILAFEYDMLEVARDNLEKAVAIKKNDPTALYFYARILKETAKTDQERATADDYFRLAAENDSRSLNYGAALHRAVAMLNKSNITGAEKQEAVSLLKQYVENYYLVTMRDMKSDSYPPHLETIYDYMSRLGEFQYVLDEKKVAELRAVAQKLAESSNVVDVRKGDAPLAPAAPHSPQLSKTSARKH